MTHDELKSEMFNIVDHLNMMVDNQELLDIATEFSQTFSKQNFDRISLLLEIYNSRTECVIEELRASLTRVAHALPIHNHSLDKPQYSDNSATII
jgi:hypothetical protein